MEGLLMMSLFQNREAFDKGVIREFEVEPNTNATITRRMPDESTEENSSKIFDTARMIYFNAKRRQFSKSASIF